MRVTPTGVRICGSYHRLRIFDYVCGRRGMMIGSSKLPSHRDEIWLVGNRLRLVGKIAAIQALRTITISNSPPLLELLDPLTCSFLRHHAHFD